MSPIGGHGRSPARERKRWRGLKDGAALLQRRDFVAAAKTGRKQVRSGLVLQARANYRTESPTMRVGLTASRKVGNAVARNRAKRRLRAAARSTLIPFAAGGYDYVLIARRSTLERPFDQLCADVESCLKRLGLFRGPAENRSRGENRKPPSMEADISAPLAEEQGSDR